MKANGAPEKIYLVIDPVWGSMSVNYNRNDTNNIEYFRADAFIEKAQLFLIDKLKEIPMGSGKMKIKAECSLDEFIEGFENYMEGE